MSLLGTPILDKEEGQSLTEKASEGFLPIAAPVRLLPRVGDAERGRVA